MSIGLAVVCLPWLRWKHPEWDRPIRVHWIWPLLYTLATIFITIVPMVASPVETGKYQREYISKGSVWNYWKYITGLSICIWKIFESGCGIQMSQATPTKFSMLFKHNYGKLSWKFGDHSLNFSFVHGPSWLRILESIHRYGVIFTFCKKISKGHCEAMLDVKKIYFIDF